MGLTRVSLHHPQTKMENMTTAFTPTLPLRTNLFSHNHQLVHPSIHHPQSFSRTSTTSVSPSTPTFNTTPQLSLSTSQSKTDSPPAPSQKGKRVPTYKKLQTRHRTGPSSFRQSAKTLITKKGVVTVPQGGLEEPVESAETIEAKAQAVKQKEKEKEKEKERKRKLIKLKDLKVGQEFEGTIRNTVKHGAYISIGSTRDGLCHIRDMAIDFVHEVEDILRPGDKVKVWVKYIDVKKYILALTMIKPILGFEKHSKSISDISKLQVGVRVEGVIQRVTNFGAYVDIGYERLAFVHIRSLWGRRPRQTLYDLQLGQFIHAEILEIDTVKNYIRLGARGHRGIQLANDVEIEATEVLGDENEIKLESETIKRRALLRVGEDFDDGYDHGPVNHEDEFEGEIELAQEKDTADDDIVDANALSQVLTDNDDDDDDDEFGFAEEMMMSPKSSHSKYNDDDDGDDVDFSKIAHLIDADTEFVGIDDSDLKKLKDLKSKLENLE